MTISKIRKSTTQVSASKQIFLIVSDKAKRLFLYDWGKDTVIQSFSLNYKNGGRYRESTKAESITFNPDNKRLYIVNDEKAQLFVFELKQC